MSSTSAFLTSLDRFESFINEFRRHAQGLVLKEDTRSHDAKAARRTNRDARLPENLREAVRNCFGQLPEEFDTTEALRIVDGHFPQFRGREKSTRSQAVGIVAAEFGATPLGKLGKNCCERWRKKSAE